ncbi:MAG: hypothetical protein HYZ62_02095 [Candidatus Andersenbacteria bacterium]|nr:hypothetical protein [Candidatus Andersenbacteria bacterium]
MRPIFGSDVDDTAIISSHITETYWEYLAERNIPHSREVFAQTHSWRLAIPGHDPNKLYTEFVKSGRAPPIREMPGARDAFAKISQSHDIHFITVRDPVAFEAIKPDMLKFLGPMIGAGYWPVAGEKKNHRVQSLGVRYFVDDSAEVHSDLQAIPGLTLIQFPSFHNGVTPKVDGDNIIRLPACDEVGCGLPKETICRLAWEQVMEIVES